MNLVFNGDWAKFIAFVPDAKTLQDRTLTAWADRAAAFARRNAVLGALNSNYLNRRSGLYQNNIFGKVTGPDAAVLSVTHPGAVSNEIGAVIRPVRAQYLRFRLYRPGDRTVPTGNWVRARMVTIPARMTITKSGLEAVNYVQLNFARIATGGFP